MLFLILFLHNILIKYLYGSIGRIRDDHVL